MFLYYFCCYCCIIHEDVKDPVQVVNNRIIEVPWIWGTHITGSWRHAKLVISTQFVLFWMDVLLSTLSQKIKQCLSITQGSVKKGCTPVQVLPVITLSVFYNSWNTLWKWRFNFVHLQKHLMMQPCERVFSLAIRLSHSFLPECTVQSTFRMYKTKTCLSWIIS